MVNVAIYSGGVVSLPAINNSDKHLCFFGFLEDEQKTDVLIKISDFEPYVILLPEQGRSYDEDYLNYVAKEINHNHKLAISRVEMKKQISSQGFTNSREDTLFYVYCRKDWHLYGLLKHFKQASHFGDIPIRCLISADISHHVQFMLQKHIQFQTWVTIDQFVTLPDTHSHGWNIEVDYRHSYMETNQEWSGKKIIVPNLIYVCIFAPSTVATKTNLCQSNAEIDPVTHIAYAINDAVPNVLYNTNEKELLDQFHNILHSHHIHFVVFCSDDIHSVLYLATRSNIVGSCFSWCKIKNVRTNINVWKGRTTVQHPGIERFDLRKQLQKTMCNPPLAEYTLLHAVRHKDLIPNKRYIQNEEGEKVPIDGCDLFGLFYDRNYQPPSMFTHSLEDISMDLHFTILLMQHLMNINGFVQNALTVSKVYDFEIQNVLEKGQTKKLLGMFHRKLYNYNLYFDHLTVQLPTYMVAMKNEDSSFPNPPWIENPDPEELLFGKKNTNLIYKPKKKKQKTTSEPTTYGGGLVLDPIPGFYRSVRRSIPTLDWASMYPNIIISFLICTMTQIRDSKWIDDPKATLQYIPRNKTHCDVRITHYDGKPVFTYLPKMVAELLELRETERELGKQSKTSQERNAHKMAEMAYKQGSNSSYGFYGCKTSPMRCFAIASSITAVGRFMQQTVRHEILKTGNGCVVYGDTDSCMPLFRVDENITDEKEILANIIEQAKRITTFCSEKFKPNKIIVESVKSPMIMLPTKKTYICLDDGTFKMKGIVTLKRDKCNFARELGEELCSNLIYEKKLTIADYVNWLDTKLKKIPFGPMENALDLEPFVLSAQLNDDYKNDVALSLEVAKLIELETGRKVEKEDRLSYVVCYFADPNLLHAQRCMPLKTCLKRKLQLDVGCYLEKQIRGCLKQILSLDIYESLFHKLEMCIHTHTRRWKLYLLSRTKLFHNT